MKLYSFPNLGNTCYLNSVLQCFINDPSFKKKLINCETSLKLLLDEIDIDFTQNDENINHRHGLIKIVDYFNKKFSRFQQHDAHEFLLEFLEQTKLNIYGQMKTNVVCRTCRTVSSTLEDFSTIDLQVGGKDLITTFMDYLKSEEIHGYHCEKCNCKTIADKKTYLWRLNTTLIIVLKKYNLKQKLIYPFDNLKIRESVSGKVFDYQLYGILNHYGNSQTGHYNCNIKVNNDWYFIDDETINRIDKFDNENSYILFYKIN